MTPQATISLPIRECQRCPWVWVQRGLHKPRRCPDCGSPYWDRPRRVTRGAERKAEEAAGLLTAEKAKAASRREWLRGKVREAKVL
jgi:hypothetical protein